MPQKTSKSNGNSSPKRTNSDLYILGRKLRTIRLSKNLTQVGIMQFVHPWLDENVGRSSVSAWETGRREPSRDSLIRYAALAGISLDILLPDDAELPERFKEFENVQS